MADYAEYSEALELACNGDDDRVAFFVSEADAAMDKDRTAGVLASSNDQPKGGA